MKKILLGLFFILILTFSLNGKIYKCIDKKGLPIFSNLPCVDSNKFKKDSSFNVNFFAVKNMSEVSKWVLSNETERKNFKYIKKIKKNITVYLPVILTFKKPQTNKRVKFKATYKLIDPDKKEFKIPFVSYGKDYVDPRFPKTLVLTPVTNFIAEEGDKLGKYKLIVNVVDLLHKNLKPKTASFILELY